MKDDKRSKNQVEEFDNSPDAFGQKLRFVPQFIVAFGERKTVLEWSRDPRCPFNFKQLSRMVTQDKDIEHAILNYMPKPQPGTAGDTPGKLQPEVRKPYLGRLSKKFRGR